LVRHAVCTSYDTLHFFKMSLTLEELWRGQVTQSYTINLDLWLWPWTDLSQTCALHIDSSYLTVIGKSDQGFKRCRADTTVLLILKNHLDLEVNLNKKSNENLKKNTSEVNSISQQCFKRYRLDKKSGLNKLDFEHLFCLESDLCQTCALHIVLWY